MLVLPIAGQFEVVGLKVQEQGGLLETLTTVHTAVNTLKTARARQVLKESSIPHPGALRILTDKWDAQPDTCVNDPPCERIQFVGQLDLQGRHSPK